MSFQLPSTEEKADYVMQQFDRIARKYDLANDLISVGMHRAWKARAIKELLQASRAEQTAEERAVSEISRKRNEPPRGAVANAADSRAEQAAEERAERLYLDLCTGTGDLAMMIAERLNESDKVVGLDFSREMLAVAKQRELATRGKKRAKLEWHQGDAQNLPFADNTFEAAIISFGLRNLTDLQKGLCEMSRVVKPGGVVVNLDLGQPDMPVFTPLFLFFFDKIVPIIGEIIQQDRKAYTYLPESRKSYPHPVQLTKMFEAAGMTDIRWLKLACGSVALHVGAVK